MSEINRLLETMDSPKWYLELSEDRRAGLFAEMRRLGDEEMDHRARGRELSAPAGTIAVGGAYFDENLRAEIIASYLRALRKGATPDESKAKTETEKATYVRSFNQSKGSDYVVHRYEGAQQDTIEIVHKRILAAVGESINARD